MQTKIEAIVLKVKDRKYPYIGVWGIGATDKGFMVLFTDLSTGVVLESLNEDIAVGLISHHFIEEEFIYYLGEITLYNDPI